MLLRRIREHIAAQNWTAVGLDLVIVVVGVFLGIQVSNCIQIRRGQDRATRDIRCQYPECALRGHGGRLIWNLQLVETMKECRDILQQHRVRVAACFHFHIYAAIKSVVDAHCHAVPPDLALGGLHRIGDALDHLL